MSRRRRAKENEAPQPAIGNSDAPGAPRQEASVLLVHPARAVRVRLAEEIRDWPIVCSHASTLASAREALADRPFDLVIAALDLPGGSGLDLVHEPAAGAVIVMTDEPTLDGAVKAMQAGAADLIGPALSATELMERLSAALRRSRLNRRQQDRIERLRRVCRQLNTARQEVSRQVGSLCNDLVSAYNELSDQLGRVSIASEFGSLVRQELDIEDLLRTALEYLLSKAGPTNAAVFLPDSSGEFTLGAYVNYDCAKDGAEALFDQLACVIAPRFEHTREVIHLEDDTELADRLGDDARWMAGNACTAFACRHEDECLAVVTLFRSPRQPFASDFLALLPVVAESFGRQLGKVIHVHHRHLPKDQWGTFGADDSDYGLAA